MGSTVIITTVGAEVAGVSSLPYGSVLDDSVLLVLLLCASCVMLTDAVRRPGAARRRPRQLQRRGAAAAIIGWLGRAARAFPAALVGPRGSPVRLAVHCVCMQKVANVAPCFLAL